MILASERLDQPNQRLNLRGAVGMGIDIADQTDSDDVGIRRVTTAAEMRP